MTEPGQSAEARKAKRLVFRLIKLRSRSEKEIRDYLHKKSFDSSVMDAVVDYFKKIDLINDRLFTKSWIQSRLCKPYGARRIAFELNAKGIAKDTIEEELAFATNSASEEEAVTTIIARRSRLYQNLDKKKKWERLYGYLSRRGFESGTIMNVLKKLT